MEEVIFSKNIVKAEQMETYMKNQFQFVGVPAPERKLLSKEIIKASKELTFEELFDWIAYYYQKTEREYHYVAIDMAVMNVKRLDFAGILQFKAFVTEKAWWDSVDSWRKLFGLWAFNHLDEMEAIFEEFYQAESFWQRRISIILQLQFKQQTNHELLKKAVIYDKNTEEFFIQKAIGWSLREYSKTNPDWVRTLINQEAFSNLAVREGSRYL